jgi:Tfp pilus assembly protein PilO
MTKMRQWSLMTVIAVVIVFAGGWLLLVKPQKSQISSVKAQATTQQQSNQVLLQQIAARQGQQKQLPHEQAQLQKLATQVPTVPDEPGLIRNLTASASGAGVNLLSLTPGVATAITVAPAAATGSTTLPAAAAGQLVELPISMAVVGSYANLESYFQLLEKLPRAMLVTGFSVCPEGGAGGGGCSAPVPPDGTNVPAGDVGATISANVFFSPLTPTAATGTTTTTLPGTTPTTSPTTAATTPATTPATPAATTTAAPPATTPAN